MKKLLTLFTAVLFVSVAFAGEWTKIRKDKTSETNIQLISSTDEADVVKFNLNAYKLDRVETPNGMAYTVSAPESSPMLLAGNPDLPKISQSLIIPNQGNSQIEVLYSEYIELSGIEIAPSKGNIYRDQDPSDVAYTYSDVYAQDAFYPQNLSSVNEPYIMRDVRGQTINVFPFAYNPVQKVLRIYSDVTVKVSYNNESGINELESQSLTASEDFAKIYKRQFLNYSETKYTALEEGAPGRMLIISYADFMDEMESFVTWKRQKGIETEIVDVATIGNASAIETYIANEYNTNGLNYVVLVGDEAQVPTTETGSDSDNEYVCIVGSDHYVDCFIGRISAETGADVTNQIDKILQYERDIQNGNAWLENAFCSASNEGTGGQGDDGESDEQHMQNLGADLETYGYTVTHVNQNGGSNAQISAAFNAGIGVGNYVGHGDVTLWVNTTYTNTEVNALTNTDKYPFIFSVACVNGDFKNNTCFAEAWLRANNGVKPTGAVGFLASTINQSWASPMDAQDEMVDILVESYNDNIKRTYAGISFNGMFHMIDEYGADGEEMADTWTLFGDPSMMVRTKDPVEMNITHLDVLNVGQETFAVSCDAEGALVSLTKEEADETIILGTGFISGGSVTVDIAAFTAPGNMKVTVTAFDKVTYQEDVMVIVPDGPYVVLNDVVIDDAAGNNNGVLNNGESVLLDVTLENVGVATANGVNAAISATNSDLTITDATDLYGDMAADAVVPADDAYALSVADGVADQTIIPLDFVITDGASHEWNAVHNLVVNAPALTVGFVSVDDAAGNGNGIMDPGETVSLTFVAGNEGHNDAVAGEMILNISSNGTVADSDIDVEVNSIDGSLNIVFIVEVSASAAAGSSMPMTVNYTAGAYTATGNFTLPIGLQIEDWESEDFESYEWENDASTPWTIVTEDPYAGTHCSKSGALTESGGTSVLTINLNVTTDSEVSFFKKVSCEDESWGYLYDYLMFSIDGNMQGQWAGEVAWSQESYAVTAGEHELSWTYVKDNYVTSGSDCAWIDDVVLPSHDQATFIEQTNTNVEDFSFAIMPNPAAEYAFVNFSLTERTQVSVEIIDLQGRVLANVYNQGSPEGVYRVAYDITNLPDGMYVVRLTAGNTVNSEQLIIAK